MGTALRRTGRVRIIVAFFSLFVFTILLSYGAYFLMGLRKTPETSVARHPKTTQGAIVPSINELAGRRSPNKRSLLIGMATNAADETDGAAETLFREIEPPSLPKDNDLGTANRDDLDTLRRALQTAVDNKSTIMPRYLALLKSERDSVENYARSLNSETDFVTKVLEAIDTRHADLAALTSQLLTARADFYRTYEIYAALLVAEFGRYKAIDGRLIFPMQRTVDRYNIAAHALGAAAKRLSELEGKRKRLVQLQQEQWREFLQND
jgi:hypothetical protein